MINLSCAWLYHNRHSTPLKASVSSLTLSFLESIETWRLTLHHVGQWHARWNHSGLALKAQWNCMYLLDSSSPPITKFKAELLRLCFDGLIESLLKPLSLWSYHTTWILYNWSHWIKGGWGMVWCCARSISLAQIWQALQCHTTMGFLGTKIQRMV